MPFNFRRMQDSPGSYYTTQRGGIDHQPMHVAYDDAMDQEDDTPLMTPEDQDISENAMYGSSDDDRYSHRMENRDFDDAGLPV